MHFINLYIFLLAYNNWGFYYKSHIVHSHTLIAYCNVILCGFRCNYTNAFDFFPPSLIEGWCHWQDSAGHIHDYIEFYLYLPYMYHIEKSN